MSSLILVHSRKCFQCAFLIFFKDFSLLSFLFICKRILFFYGNLSCWMQLAHAFKRRKKRIVSVLNSHIDNHKNPPLNYLGKFTTAALKNQLFFQLPHILQDTRGAFIKIFRSICLCKHTCFIKISAPFYLDDRDNFIKTSAADSS